MDEKSGCCESGRIFQCFVRDLLKCEATEKAGSTRTYFKINNYVFKKVKIRGFVTNHKEYKTQTVITVDDSTGAIECAFTKSYKGEEVKAKFQKICDEASSTEKANSSDAELSKMLLRKIQQNIASIPLASDINVADKVEVIGDLYNGPERRQIFIVDIVKLPKGDCNSDISFIERTLMCRGVLE